MRRTGRTVPHWPAQTLRKTGRLQTSRPLGFAEPANLKWIFSGTCMHAATIEQSHGSSAKSIVGLSPPLVDDSRTRPAAGSIAGYMNRTSSTCIKLSTFHAKYQSKKVHMSCSAERLLMHRKYDLKNLPNPLAPGRTLAVSLVKCQVQTYRYQLRATVWNMAAEVWSFARLCFFFCPPWT